MVALGTSMNGGEDANCSSASVEWNPCPICLAPVNQESYLDRCFHKFCYRCILRWENVVSRKHSQPHLSLRCPLCKTENFSVIHGYDGSSFQQHYFSGDSGDRLFFSKAHKSRLQCYYSEPGLLNDKFDVTRYWKSRKFLQPNKWLHNWLRREVQALMQEEDVDIVVHHILGVIDSFRKSTDRQGPEPEAHQEQFKALVGDAARPFLAGRTERFINEVELFLCSGLNIEAYDEVYIHHLGCTASTTASDNDAGTSRESLENRTMSKITSGNAEEESQDRLQLAPYLYFFEDDDSDGAD